MSPILPTYLRCEHIMEPRAIEARQPHLSWTIECSDSDRHAVDRRAYQILITLRQTFPEILLTEQMYGGAGLHTVFPAPGEV